ncbi:MAG: rsmD [Dehalococcoidia bacterium]|nr:rsmD [Dehalococcoidia bacterium]
MRVIAGAAKGRVLKVPRVAVRPTTGLVKGALFAILGSKIQDAHVLDLFAGSGALGIEALSRGAAWVDFVEQERDSCSVIRENLKATGLDTQAHVYCCKAARALAFLDRKYDVVLLDPPYADPSLEGMLAWLASSAVVKPATVLVVAHSSRRRLGDSYGPFAKVRERCHGDTCISLFKGEAST